MHLSAHNECSSTFNGSSGGKLQTKLKAAHISQDDWTHTCYSLNTKQHTRSHLQPYTLSLSVRLFHPFSKESTLTLKLLYGLPTLLLLYVFPLEAITAHTAALPPTFSRTFITFGQELLCLCQVGFVQNRKTCCMILVSIMVL